MSDEINKLIEKAFLLHKSGSFDEAGSIYENILNLFPENLEVLNLYGQLLTQCNLYNEAIDVYLNMLKINSSIYVVHYNLSLLYKKINSYDMSLEYALSAYNLNDSNIDLILHIAFLCEKLNLKEKLVFFFEKALLLDPKNELFLIKLAFLYTELNIPVKAVDCYEKCLNINPNNFNALTNLPAFLINIKKYDLAIDLSNRAINIEPNNIKGYHSLFLVYKELKEYNKAAEIAKKMIEIEPSNHIVYSSFAEIAFEYIDYNLALEYFNKALELKPNEVVYLYNIACCYSALNNFDKAFEVAEKILSISPENYDAIKLKTFSALRLGDYKKAMETYPFVVSPLRNKKEMVKFSDGSDLHKFSKYYENHWDKEDLSQKTLLLYNPDGFGDSLMYSRFIPILLKRVKKLIIEVDKNLFDLYKYNLNFNNVEIISETKHLVQGYDYTATFMSLFYCLNLGLENIPYSSGWLSVDDDTLQKIAKLDIFNNNKLKVGIFWQGNKKIMKNRFLNINDLIPLLEDNSVQYYSLDITQKDKTICDVLDKYGVIDCSAYINTFYDTAAIIKNLDLVVTIDSSIVHLSGALGIKTYLMLPKEAEWRWFNDNCSTVWYDSVKIFKQNKQGNWNDVILSIIKELH